MSTSLEREIRLSVPADLLAKVFRARALAKLRMGSEVKRKLTTTYWDTPDLDFHRDGIALRLRTEHPGGSRLLGVKIDRGDPMAREELEVATAQDGFSFAPLIAAGWRIPRRLLKREPDIRPCMRSEIERRTRTVTFPEGTQIELAIDGGRLVSARGKPESCEDVAELELEVMQGDPRRSYELAFALIAEIPRLRLLFASKAERGFALLTGTAPPPRKGEVPALASSSGATAGEVAVAAAAEALAQIARNLEGARLELDGAHVHQLRIGVRRYRMTTRMARRAGLPLPSQALRKEFRALWDVLGATRDWDVFERATWPAVAQHARLSEDMSDAAIGPIVAQRRTTQRTALRSALESPNLQRALIAAFWAIENQREAARETPQKAARPFARKLLDRALKRVLRRGRRLHGLSAAERHALRIEAKKLRYSAEYVRPLFGEGKSKRYLKRLERLQTSLGSLNDLDVGRALLAKALAECPEDARTTLSAAWDDYEHERSRRLDRELAANWRDFTDATRFWRR